MGARRPPAPQQSECGKLGSRASSNHTGTKPQFFGRSEPANVGIRPRVSAIPRFKRRSSDRDGNTRSKSKAGRSGKGSCTGCRTVLYASPSHQLENFSEYWLDAKARSGRHPGCPRKKAPFVRTGLSIWGWNGDDYTEQLAPAAVSAATVTSTAAVSTAGMSTARVSTAARTAARIRRGSARRSAAAAAETTSARRA